MIRHLGLVVLYVVGVLCCLFLATGCRGVVYRVGTIGTFPSQVSTKGGWQDWSSYAKIPGASAAECTVSYYYETSDPGGASALQDKHVWIRVRRAKGNDPPRLLNDELFFRCSSIKAYVRWETFETLEIDLVEKGHEYTGDDAPHNVPYSVEMARNGPRRLARLTYVYDEASGQFVRSRANYPPSESIDPTDSPTTRRQDIITRVEQEVSYLIAGNYYGTYIRMYDSTDPSVDIESVRSAFDDAVESKDEYVPKPDVVWFRDASTREVLARVTFAPRTYSGESITGEPLVVYVRDNWELKLTGVRDRKLVPDGDAN